MSIQIEGPALRDLNEALRREWLETNGVGGWAGSTLAGAHARRDQGLLVVPGEEGRPPVVLLSRLDETLYLPCEGGADVFELGTNLFPGGVYPQGYRHLSSFQRALFPVFEWEAGPVRLRKTIAAKEGEAATLVVYEVLEAPAAFLFELRPFVAARDVRSFARANDLLVRDATFERSALHLAPYPELPELFVKAPGSTFHYQPDWWYHFRFAGEPADSQEDLFTPGVLRFELAAGDRVGILISTADPAGRDPLELFDQERRRREKLAERLPVQDELTRLLAVAADQFSLRRGASERTLAAGYPGGDETLADTLIALPGLLLATGRLDDAKRVLRTAARAVAKDGSLPDRLAAEPAFTSLDGPLWMFPAVFRYLEAGGDEGFVRDSLLPALLRIAAAYDRGTAAGVRATEDGLLEVEGGFRAGLPVELNALWAEARATLAALAARLGEPAAAKAAAERARRTARRFVERFWNDAAGAFFDRLEGGARHAEIRPFQVLALCLPHPVLPKAKAARLLETLEAELSTPFGLKDRPLSELEEGRASRAWTWLLGGFLTALVRVHGAAGRKQALRLLEELEPHLLDGVVGSIAEVVEPYPPHAAHGRLAAAASVGELLRAYVEDLHPAPAARPSAPAPRPKKAAAKGAPAPGRSRGAAAKPAPPAAPVVAEPASKPAAKRAAKPAARRPAAERAGTEA